MPLAPDPPAQRSLEASDIVNSIFPPDIITILCIQSTSDHTCYLLKATY